MTRSRWGAARLATLLLLAMVGVAGEAMPAPPVPPTNHTVEDDYEYYYDYDYYYDENGSRKLNMSEFRLPKEQRRIGEPYVPRYMLELYAEQSLSRQTPLPGADLVRSFTAVNTGESLKRGVNSGHFAASNRHSILVCSERQTTCSKDEFLLCHIHIFSALFQA